MKRILKKSFAIALPFVGAMIGVGLASGREVVSFFAKYGFLSPIFCCVSGLVFFVLIYVCVKINMKTKNIQQNKKRKMEQYAIKNEYITQIQRKNTLLHVLYNAILYVCQISICSAMFAGIYSILGSFNISFVLKFLLLFVVFLVSFLILNGGNKMVYGLNAVLSILLILFSLFIFFYGLCFSRVNFAKDCSFSFIVVLKSVLYAGMNVLTVYPILKESSRFVENKKEIFFISLFSSMIISALLIFVCLCVLLFGGSFLNDDMVMLSISKSFGSLLFVVHFCLICFSIFSTLLSTAYGAGLCLKARGWGNILNLSISFVLSFVGFSNIIDFLYPALGFVFIVYIVFLLISTSRKNASC